ncbi:orotidine-5'-phosphate decarboxylase [Thermosediminibacter litoriperuensis]|uniref:Orotidine 5'-phosphate decarboxylase n=1 Tax=Thermosediminibacter litoriperuensis TaxID=291989 RepID=A0A5S5AMA5_9FIRM|nr:orotidine-5'-phosphate decarboxylase [Thermosediminibacter litoriperuensis]TYP52484.1 orotidine-5'-phosphate decarboxylase [Thermosediminibacter litoriperuensis]
MTQDFSKVIIALDTPDENKALGLVRLLKNRIRVFKVGLELFCSAGPAVIKKINAEGCRVFLDLKFHDIPNTVAGAARAAVRSGAFMFNVHASGGREMMQKAREAAERAFIEKENHPERPKILAVTVLTSLDDRDLREMNITESSAGQAVRLAKLALAAGMDGVVTSPGEIEAIRNAVGKDFLIVTPGVRPPWAGTGDQKRVATPKEALKAGADYIVIGRPVTAAPDPLAALERIFV